MIREFHPPFGGDWDTPSGRKIIKVRLFSDPSALEALIWFKNQLVIRESVSHYQLEHPNIAEFLGLHQASPLDAPSMVIRRAQYHSASMYLKDRSDARSFVVMVSMRRSLTATYLTHYL